MKINIQNMQVSYRGNEIEKVYVYYQAMSDEDSFQANGRVAVSNDEYDGSVQDLQNKCKDHLEEKIDELEYQIIRSNITYERERMKNVHINFNARTNNSDLRITGGYKLDAETYQEDSSLEALVEHAKDFIRDMLVE